MHKSHLTIECIYKQLYLLLYTIIELYLLVLLHTDTLVHAFVDNSQITTPTGGVYEATSAERTSALLGVDRKFKRQMMAVLLPLAALLLGCHLSDSSLPVI